MYRRLKLDLSNPGVIRAAGFWLEHYRGAKKFPLRNPHRVIARTTGRQENRLDHMLSLSAQISRMQRSASMPMEG